MRRAPVRLTLTPTLTRAPYAPAAVTEAPEPFNLRRFLFSGSGWPYLLVPFIALAIVLDLAHADPIIVFFSLRARRRADARR